MLKSNLTDSVKKVTATVVAERAGVSKWTVSRAFTEGASISPKSLERVLNAAKELGYRPNLLARSLSKKRTNIVGVVVDDLANPHKLIMIDQVTRQLQRRGMMTMMLNVTPDLSYKPAISLADQFQVDGLIFLGNVLTDELLTLAREVQHIPLIVLARNSQIPDIQVVNTDGYQAGKEIAELLIQQGHRSFGYMAGPVTESTQLERSSGFRDCLAKHGLALDLQLEGGRYERSAGYKAMTDYLVDTPVTQQVDAVFCENDILAIGAMDALRFSSQGKKGQEKKIAIVGFDDIELASAPAYDLTTYRQPIDKMVTVAIERLQQAPNEPFCHSIPGELIVRTSHLSS